ncbi:MarR family transcriptional regulator [Streptomyces sp. CA-111067]|uniref:MarR family transcriptional regulator n=1 Tax=Streptomyces sp. CA-111067 TaxID=3240046 RepID=UPI003D95B8FD
MRRTTAASGGRTGAAADEWAIDAWRRIRSISGNPATLAGEHRFMHESGLTGGPMRALRCLPLDEPLSMRQLAARMGCDNSYVTPLVDSLERRGLANRRARAARVRHPAPRVLRTERIRTRHPLRAAEQDRHRRRLTRPAQR